MNLFFLPRAEDLRVTILPFLFFIRSLFFRPPVVFSLRPLKTAYFARLPFAILLTRFAFFFFIAPPFIIDFMAFMAFFMDFFMDLAMDFFMDLAILRLLGKKF